MSEGRARAPETPRTAGDMVRMSREFLERKGVESARLEAELLVAHALGIDRLRLFLSLDRPLVPAEIDRARDALVRRGRREPAAYITGSREFYGRPFQVGPGVLVPRPETELLVDRAREIAKERGTGALRIADVGTGSGCIAVTLALELPGARVLALDVSAAAVLCARANADALGASVEIVEGEGLAELDRATAIERFDLVVSNPPYVGTDERGTLAPEVAEHEPAIALFAPQGDPDFWVRSLLDRARIVLAPGGKLLVELGHRQAAGALTLARDRGLQARTHRDLDGIERLLEVE
ncbi:MAG: peptide chain release factor N(5)-glutamine methyltransferase [Planctomycetota bacterium]